MSAPGVVNGSAMVGGPGGTAEGAVPHECVAAADALLAQAAGFVVAVDDVAYARGCDLAAGGTIGKHLRHCLDHFAAVLCVGKDADGSCLVDYDHRERDVPMESCRRAGVAEIAGVRARLAGLGPGDMGRAVRVRVMVGADGRTVDLSSTLGRELAFATHHALHHHAMVGFIAAAFGVRTPEGFGKAPATLHHEHGWS